MIVTTYGRAFPATPRNIDQNLKFEVYTVDNADLLRLTLASLATSCSDALKSIRSLGFLPRNSIVNKLPYHRRSSQEPINNLSKDLQWVVDTKAKLEQRPIDVPVLRRKPTYIRDALTLPSAVLPVNILLMLALFNIDALVGSKVVIELRRDTIVKGTLVSCDDTLNMLVEEATIKPLQGPVRQVIAIHIGGRSVRYIHVPPSLEPAAAIEKHRKEVSKVLKAHGQQQAAAIQRLQKGDGSSGA